MFNIYTCQRFLRINLTEITLLLELSIYDESGTFLNQSTDSVKYLFFTHPLFLTTLLWT